MCIALTCHKPWHAMSLPGWVRLLVAMTCGMLWSFSDDLSQSWRILDLYLFVQMVWLGVTFMWCALVALPWALHRCMLHDECTWVICAFCHCKGACLSVLLPSQVVCTGRIFSVQVFLSYAGSHSAFAAQFFWSSGIGEGYNLVPYTKNCTYACQ